jgi:Type I phosphodiesterase / nucleotide pyrophosphatase
MRGLIAALFLAPPLIGATAPAGAANAPEPPRPRNVVLFVAGGLRPGMVSEQTTPAMAALLRRGVTFTNAYSQFPTLASPNAAAMATGHEPGDTGAFANTIGVGVAIPGAGASLTPPPVSDPVLADLTSHFSSGALDAETVLHAAATAGLSTASIGALGPTLRFDPSARTGQQTVIVDDETGHAGGIPLSAEMQAAFHEFGVAPQAPLPDADTNASPAAATSATPAAGAVLTTSAAPATGGVPSANAPPAADGVPVANAPPAAGGVPVANAPPAASAAQSWFADVATLAVLPTFKERRKPFVIVFWSRNPASALFDQDDPPLRLIPGINGAAFMAAIKQADSDLARLLAALRELGLEATTDVILASDHGLSTISKETATSYAAGRSYKGVPTALLPPGFVAIDLAHVLRMTLFDPDATGDARNFPVPAGSFPIRGNGLIGDQASRPYVVVVANGGSDLIYLPTPDKLLAARIVQFLAAQDYVSGLFVDPRLGSIGGTLPLSAIALDGAASVPAPAVVVNFRTFSSGCADPTACGVEVADTVLQQGQGTGGSFSRADTRIVLGAAGPEFRPGFQDPAPAGTADIGTTIAALLGLKLKDQGRLSGRVLTEAMPHGAPVFAKSGILKSAPDDWGRVTELKYQTVGGTRYFDAAGYPGRTLGLE